MSRFSRLIPVVAVTILLAACGQDGVGPMEPAGPSLDTGVLTTGGNNTNPDSASTPASTSGPSTEGGEAQSDTTGRGVLTMGGN